MVTTKVGGTPSSKTKRPSRVALSPVVKKKTTTKKTKDKITSKSISHNTAERSQLSKDKKKSTTEQSVVLKAKLENVSKLHKQKSSPIKESRKVNILPQIRPKAALALLSPYRFPVPTQAVAVATARIGGLFFVITGAIFTLFFANNFFGAYGLTAQVISTFNTLDPITTTLTTTSVAPVPQEVSFDVNNPDNLQGSVQVKIRVKDAEKLTLTAFYKTQKQEVTLGRPVKVSSDTWEFYWDTTAFDDGEYKFKAIVNNGYETYERLDSSYVIVANTSFDDSITVTSSGTYTDDSLQDILTEDSVLEDGLTTIEDSATQELGYEDVYLNVDSDQSLTEFRFEIEASNADKVKLYAVAPESTKSILIGYAYKADSTTWKHRWVVSTFAKGDYEVTAAAVIDTQEYLSNSIIVTVGESIDKVEEEIFEESTLDTDMTPAISLSILKGSPLFGVADVRVDVVGALAVEMYLLPKYALTERYLGGARHVDKGAWIYSWDTRLVPNGEYVVIAEVENEYGLYTQQSNSIKVFNQQKTALTEDEELKIAVLSKLGEEIEEAEEETASTEDADLEVASEDEQKLGAEVLAVVNEEEAFNDLINSFKAELEEDLQRLASALRMNNSDDIERAEKRLETLRDTIIQSDLSDNDRERLIERIDIYIEAAIERIESNVQKTNQLIAERTAEKVVTDSDDDGISDFDEVNLYNTNPFSADTDNDGFTDGAEILSGYNPNDASAEALVAYESPKENGIVREDILVVDSVITATKNDTDEEERPSAIISGKALPNSFVTLYVFSTPIVVTVKTDADGSWNYRFDKEIEDGEHQVYIGVTDNAGKLVAKSNPFTFIKQAEAFTGANAAANAETVPAPVGEKTLIGEYMIYLVLSISVVAIGLLLILLGLHLDARPRKLLAAQEGTQAVV